MLFFFPSYTFQQVQEHTDQIWKFQRHDLIEEYHGRPPAPPPFILLSHLHLFVKRYILQKPAILHKQLSKNVCFFNVFFCGASLTPWGFTEPSLLISVLVVLCCDKFVSLADTGIKGR